MSYTLNSIFFGLLFLHDDDLGDDLDQTLVVLDMNEMGTRPDRKH